MRVTLQEQGACSGLSASIEFDADSYGAQSEYVIVIQSPQGVYAEKLAGSCIRFKVRGDFEILDIADVIQKLVTTAKNFKKEPESGS